MKSTVLKVVSTVLLMLTIHYLNAQSVSFDFTTSGASTGTPAACTVSGVGSYYKAASATSGAITINTTNTCNSQTKSVTTGSSLFVFKPSVNTSKFVIYASGTGTNRVLSTLSTASTIAGTYTTLSTTTNTSTLTTTGTCGTITIVPSSTISAGTFVQFLFSGNINISQIDVYLPCSTPTISTNPSTSTQSICAGANGTSLSVAASGTGTITYQWYKNTTNSNSGGTSISGATNNSYTPNESSAGTYYYYCTASTGTGCTATSQQSGAITVNAAPTPTFTASPGTSSTQGVDVIYTTQGSKTNYVWSVPGVLNTDYSITSGGVGVSDNTITLKWLTTGSKTVTVGYSASGCPSANPASSTTNVLSAASTFYNKPNSDITSIANWGTATDGTGTQPSDFVSAGQTFNLINVSATMGASWTVSGAGSKVVVGDGSGIYIFTASNDVNATVDVTNNATIVLQTANIPTWGTINSGSTIEYGGTSITQAVTATSYSNLTLSGSGTRTFTGTTNISGTFTPGNGFSATSGTIVLNGTSSSQTIPAFSYSSLTVGGVDGKSTSGTVTVAGTLTMNNSFTIPVSSAVILGATATMASTAAKVLTDNGTFEIQQNSVTFSAGSGSITVAAGGVFKMSGTVPNSSIAFTNVNFTSGIGSLGSTLHFATIGLPRLPATPLTFNGNLVVDCNLSNGTGILLNQSSNTTMVITGNLTVKNTGGIMSHTTGSSTQRHLTVQGNLSIQGGRYDVAAGTTALNSTLTVNGNISFDSANDTLYASSSTATGGTGTINVQGNLVYNQGVLGQSSTSPSKSTIAFTGTSMQDITVINLANNPNITLNNSNGARLLTDFSVGATLTLTSGKLRTNGYSVILNGTTGTISGASSSSYIANIDGSGAVLSAGGLTISSIGTGGRTTTQSFPIGTNTSYNPATVNNSSSAVAFTARVNNTPYTGTTSDSTVAHTWNIQPAGSANAVVGLQWNASDEGANFNRASASIAHLNAGVTDVYSSGGASSGSNPYTLNSGSTLFTSFGDFGLVPGIIIPANEPTTQASGAIVTTTTSTTATLTWALGNGTNSIVVIKQGSAVTASPADGLSYTDGSAVFAIGTNLGSGNYVVYTGTGNSVTVTGLTIGTQYYFAVYSFNGSNGSENYLATSPTTANGTTTIPTYYYVGGTGNITNTFATANMWSTTLGGTPLSAFTPAATDVFIFDGSNIGGGVSDSISIAWINSVTTVGKIILQNNARVRIDAGGTRTVSIGNSGFVANTTALDVPSGSKLYFSGSGTTISLAANSSAVINGNLQLGNASNNVALVPNASGSTITINSGAYVEINGSSSSLNTFGTSTTPLTTFKNGSTLKLIKASDVFGGAGNNAVSFEQTSLFIYANTSNSTAMTASGRIFGNVQIEANWSPAGHGGFTMYNVSMPNATGYTFTINDSTTINFKGDITISTGNTFKFNTSATTTISTCNFNGSGLQTITNNGTWTVGSTLRQNFVVNNGAGLNVAGSVGIAASGLTGSSFTLNSGNTLGLNGGSLLVPNSGTLNINGSITRTGGNINATSSTSTVNITGASNVPANSFKGDTAANLNLNRASGITFNGNLNIITAVTLTDGVINMGNNSMNIYAGKTLTRVNGWVNGTLRKNITTGTNKVVIYEIGDAANYLPVTMKFASVTTAGDVSARTQIPATAYANFATAPMSVVNYLNRYWTLTNVNTLSFTNYGASLNWVAGDIVGSSTSSSVKAVRYNSGWTKSNPTSLTATSDSVLAQTALGTFILGDDCITYTPDVSITSTTTAVCSGSSVTFTATPVNPGSAPTYQWKKNGTTNIGTNSTSLTLQDYEVTTGDVITCVMTANNVCQTASTITSNGITLLVGTVTPSLSISTANDTVCSGNSVTFNAVGVNPGPSPVYRWKKNGLNITTGSSITFAPNSLQTGDIITCELTANNPCQTTAVVNSNSIALTVQQSPATPTILSQYATNTTSIVICSIGNSVSLYPSISRGVWSSTNTSVATVANGGATTSSSILTAVSSGTTVINYTLTTTGTHCTAGASITVKVSPQSIPAAVTGQDAICVGSSAVYTTSATGGVWGSAGRVSINSGGVATALSAGNTSIKYTIINSDGCSASSSKSITVNPLPAVPTINYASATAGIIGSGGYCKNKTFTLAGTPSGGIWSSTGAFSITSGGVVTTAATTGSGSVTYTYTNANGCTNSRTINSNVVSCGSKGVSSEITTSNSIQYILYPNPAKSIINIKLDKAFVGAGTIIITDLYGKQIRQQSLSLGTNTLDVSNYAKGIYLVSVITEQGKETKKIIVE